MLVVFLLILTCEIVSELERAVWVVPYWLTGPVTIIVSDVAEAKDTLVNNTREKKGHVFYLSVLSKYRWWLWCELYLFKYTGVTAAGD